MVHRSVIKDLLHVKVEVLLVWADCTDELGDVVRVQGTGLSWKATGKICEANMGNALKDTNKIPFSKHSFRTMQHTTSISVMNHVLTLVAPLKWHHHHHLIWPGFIFVLKNPISI